MLIRALVLMSCVAGLAAGCTNTPLPSFARPPTPLGFRQIAHGTIASNAREQDRYWLYAGSAPYRQALDAISANLTQRDWDVLPPKFDGSVNETVAVATAPEKDQCLLYVDFLKDRSGVASSVAA